MKVLDLLIVAVLAVAPFVVLGAIGDGGTPTGVDRHGNNPTWDWVGVNVGGELFAMPADEYLILSALTDIADAALAAGNAGQCGELAILICGEGQICCFCYSGDGVQSCSFSCQDAAGDCEPCPECGPDVQRDYGTSAS